MRIAFVTTVLVCVCISASVSVSALECSSLVDVTIVSSTEPFAHLSSSVKPDSSYHPVMSTDTKLSEPTDLNSGSGGVYQFVFSTDASLVKTVSVAKAEPASCPSGFATPLALHSTATHDHYLCLDTKHDAHVHQSVFIVSTSAECDEINHKFHANKDVSSYGSSSGLSGVKFVLDPTEIGLCAKNAPNSKARYLCKKALPSDLSKNCKRYHAPTVGFHNFKHAFAKYWPLTSTEREQNCLLFFRSVHRLFGPLAVAKSKSESDKKAAEVAPDLHYHKLGFHDGVDFPANVTVFGKTYNAPVVAVADGKIVHIDACRINEQLGCNIVVKHSGGPGFHVNYANLNLQRPTPHLKDPFYCPVSNAMHQCGFSKLKVGQEVKAGEGLGSAGSNGDATYSQLHLTVFQYSHLVLVKVPGNQSHYDFVWSDDVGDTPYGRHRDFCECGTEHHCTEHTLSHDNRRTLRYSGQWLRACHADPKPLTDAECEAEPQSSCEPQSSGNCFWDSKDKKCRSIYKRVMQTSTAYCSHKSEAECVDDLGICQFDEIRPECVPTVEYRDRMRKYIEKFQKELKAARDAQRLRELQELEHTVQELLKKYESSLAKRKEAMFALLKKEIEQLEKDEATQHTMDEQMRRQQAELLKRWGEISQHQLELDHAIQQQQHVLEKNKASHKPEHPQAPAPAPTPVPVPLPEPKKTEPDLRSNTHDVAHTDTHSHAPPASNKASEAEKEKDHSHSQSDHGHSSHHRQIVDEGARDEGHGPVVDLEVVQVGPDADGRVVVKCPAGFGRLGDLNHGHRKSGESLFFLCVKRTTEDLHDEPISDIALSHSSSCGSGGAVILNTESEPANFARDHSHKSFLCVARTGKDSVTGIQTLGDGDHAPSGWKSVGSAGDGVHIACKVSPRHRKKPKSQSKHSSGDSDLSPQQQLDKDQLLVADREHDAIFSPSAMPNLEIPVSGPGPARPRRPTGITVSPVNRLAERDEDSPAALHNGDVSFTSRSSSHDSFEPIPIEM